MQICSRWFGFPLATGSSATWTTYFWQAVVAIWPPCRSCRVQVGVAPWCWDSRRLPCRWSGEHRRPLINFGPCLLVCRKHDDQGRFSHIVGVGWTSTDQNLGLLERSWSWWCCVLGAIDILQWFPSTLRTRPRGGECKNPVPSRQSPVFTPVICHPDSLSRSPHLCLGFAFAGFWPRLWLGFR